MFEDEIAKIAEIIHKRTPHFDTETKQLVQNPTAVLIADDLADYFETNSPSIFNRQKFFDDCGL